MGKYAIVLDTETTDLNRCFCYDIGWCILNKETQHIEDFHNFVIEQVWHNLPLFESAYYKDKRQSYVKMMRRHDIIMDKWGYVMRVLNSDIKKYGIDSDSIVKAVLDNHE